MAFLLFFRLAPGCIDKSFVMDLPSAPDTAQAVADIQTTLAIEFGCEVAILINWDDLSADEAMRSDGRYHYHVGFNYTDQSGSGLGSTQIALPAPISTVATLRDAEERLRAWAQNHSVTFVSCKPLAAPRERDTRPDPAVIRFN